MVPLAALAGGEKFNVVPSGTMLVRGAPLERLARLFTRARTHARTGHIHGRQCRGLGSRVERLRHCPGARFYPRAVS